MLRLDKTKKSAKFLRTETRIQMTPAATGSTALGLQLPVVLAIPNALASIHCGDHEDYFMVLQVSYDLSNAALHNLSGRKSLS